MTVLNIEPIAADLTAAQKMVATVKELDFLRPAVGHLAVAHQARMRTKPKGASRVFDPLWDRRRPLGIVVVVVVVVVVLGAAVVRGAWSALRWWWSWSALPWWSW